MKNKLFIFSNESIFKQDEKYFCDNIDIKSSPEGLNKKFEVILFGRKSSKKRAHEIKLKKIRVFSNIFSYLLEVIKSTKAETSKYLVISISPYTFITCLFVKILGKTPIVYLRSDGYGEYKFILGSLGKFIYHLMFNFISLTFIPTITKYVGRLQTGFIYHYAFAIFIGLVSILTYFLVSIGG